MPTLLIDKRVGSTRMLGYSLAGEETVVALPELNVCFDAGRSPREMVSVDHLCLSHGHMDHAAGVAYYLSQRSFLGAPPGTVVAHRELAAKIERLMAVWAEIEGHPSPGNIVGVESGQDVALRRNLVLRPFAVNHTRTALGFSVVEVRHKLKPEFVGRSGPQLVKLKQQGTAIENRLEVPLVAYCGDTAVADFLDLDHVRNARVVILECTFFDHEHVSRARLGRHIHVRDLCEVMARLRSPHIVLVHLTRRTDLRAAKRILGETVKPTDVERVTFLMERPRRPGRAPNQSRAREEADY